MAYGLPYKGSKQAICKWLFNQLPPAENFYDLFGGGGSCTHFACLTGHYKNIYYNELNSNIYQGFKDAIAGKYLNRKEWIDRETFLKNIGKGDLYNDFVFSFGYKGKEYFCSTEKEEMEKAIFLGSMHQDYRLFEKINKIKVPEKITPAGFRKLLRDYNLRNRPKENADRINSLTALQPFEINFSNLSYDEVKIKPNSVIYCDIPYFGTGGYDFEFNYKNFYEWANRQTEIVFISEYYMPEELFTCVATINKKCTLSLDNSAETTEKLFIPRAQEALFKQKVITLF
jgi:site-specific DNA-adenine methylase